MPPEPGAPGSGFLTVGAMDNRAYYLKRAQRHLALLESAAEPAVIEAHRGLASLYLDCAGAVAEAVNSPLRSQSPTSEVIEI